MGVLFASLLKIVGDREIGKKTVIDDVIDPVVPEGQS
jgi:hypothetical protein